MEQGRKSDKEGTDTRLEEVSDVEMHVVMEQLFQESPVSISPGINSPHSSSSANLDLPLVLYKPIGEIFVKLCELSRLQHSQSPIGGQVSSGTVSGPVSQPGSNDFILIPPNQVGMARSLTRYPEFSSKGNYDVEQHWYLCGAILRAR